MNQAIVSHIALPGHELARADMRPGETIAHFLDRSGWSFRLPTICVVNGLPVLRSSWQTTIILDTDAVMFLSRPMGKDSGGSGKQIMGIVGLIALAAFAPWAGAALFGAGTFGAALASAAIVVGGSLLLNTLTAPKPGGQSGNDQIDQIYSVSTSGNVAKPLQPRPVWYGRVKAFPDFVSTPWSEFDGNDQYLNILLSRGEGKSDPEFAYIDDTILWSKDDGINDALQGVDIAFYDPGESVTLFPVNVVQADTVSGQQLPDPETDLNDGWVGGFIANAADTQANALAIDLVFPGGCFTYVNGQIESASVTVECQVRTVNGAGAPTSAYGNLFTRTFTFATRSPQRMTVKTAVGANRYEVRVRRTDAPDTGANGSNGLVWAGLRSFIAGPSSFPVSTMAIRIKATEQLTQSAANKFGLIQTRILPVWDVDTQTWVEQPTRSAAWAAWDAATNTSYGLKRPVSKVDFQTLFDLALAADERGDTFDYIFSNAVPAPQAIDTILKVTRARHRWSGDVMTFVRDEWRGGRQMLLTDREIARGSIKVEWALNSDDSADSVIVEYLDEDTWRPSEVQFPVDTFEFTATNPTRIRLDGIVNREQAYREAAFYYLQAQYRRTRVTLDTEHDGRLLSFGSAVRVQSELPQSWGASGSVIAREFDTLILDTDLDWSGTDPFYIEVRDSRGRPFGPVLVTQGASANEAVLDEDDLESVESLDPFDRTLDDALDRADSAEEPSFSFGAGTKTSRMCVVVSGRPSGDRVTLNLFVDDLRVHETDLGSIPPAPTPPVLSDASAPIVAGLFANFRQGQLEPILDATWWPAAGAVYYLAQVSYDSGASWMQVYEGASVGFSVVVDRAALRLRVQAVGARQGAWTYVDVTAPNISLAPETVSPGSMQAGLHDYVMTQLGERLSNLDFRLQRIASNAADQDAANALDVRNVRVLVSVTTDSLQAQITEVAEIAQSADGRLEAAYFLILDVNGYISGIAAYNDGSTSDFVIIADTFQVAQPGEDGGDPVPVFQIANVDGEAKLTFRGDMIADGDITAEKITVSSLSALSADVGTVTAGMVKSTDDKLKVDLNNKRIIISD